MAGPVACRLRLRALCLLAEGASEGREKAMLFTVDEAGKQASPGFFLFYLKIVGKQKKYTCKVDLTFLICRLTPSVCFAL